MKPAMIYDRCCAVVMAILFVATLVFGVALSVALSAMTLVGLAHRGEAAMIVVAVMILNAMQS